MKVAITREFSLVVIECGECGVNFGVPERFDEQRRESGGNFYCPNGHPRVYRVTETDRLKQELARAAKNLEIAETQARRERDRCMVVERSRSALRGQVTKIRNRIANGVCPCCNRTFTDLGRHMITQHPEFAADISDDAGGDASFQT